jgi:hypothetical protein
MALLRDRKCVIPSNSKSKEDIIYRQQNLICQYNNIYYPGDTLIENKKPYIPSSYNKKDIIQQQKATAFKKTLQDTYGWELLQEEFEHSTHYYFKHPYSKVKYPVGWKYFGKCKVMIPQYIPESDSHELSTNKKPNDKYSLPWYFSELTYDYYSNSYDFSDYNISRKGKRAMKKIEYCNKRYERKKLFENNS